MKLQYAIYGYVIFLTWWIYYTSQEFASLDEIPAYTGIQNKYMLVNLFLIIGFIGLMGLKYIRPTALNIAVIIVGIILQIYVFGHLIGIGQI